MGFSCGLKDQSVIAGPWRGSWCVLVGWKPCRCWQGVRLLPWELFPMAQRSFSVRLWRGGCLVFVRCQAECHGAVAHACHHLPHLPVPVRCFRESQIISSGRAVRRACFMHILSRWIWSLLWSFCLRGSLAPSRGCISSLFRVLPFVCLKGEVWALACLYSTSCVVSSRRLPLGISLEDSTLASGS